MKSCVFRSLSEDNELILSYYDRISCGLYDICTGKYPYNYMTLDNVLDTVNQHLIYGSKLNSSWISCSKSFITDVEKYTLSIDKHEKLLRPKIAVIRYHRESQFEHNYSKEEISSIIEHSSANENVVRKFQNNRVTKLVLDASDTYGMSKLFNCGLLRNVDGTKSKGSLTGLNYARSSEEVLVFRDIPKYPVDKKYDGTRYIDKFNVPVVLSPLAYDVLYSLIKRGSISENDDYYIMYRINNFVNNYDNFWDLLTDNEKDFYRCYYKLRMQMRTMLQSVDSRSIDFNSLYIELNKIKIALLNKVITSYNLKYGTDYYTDPYILFSKEELIDNNIDTTDVELYLGLSKRLIKKLN